MSAWTDHVAKWKDCTRCPLHEQRSNIVLARGQVPCDVCFVGEAPGTSEDALGQPFVGPAGNLLDQIVKRALSDVAMCATCGRLRYREGDDWTCANGHARRDDHGGRDVRCAFTNLVACFPREAKEQGTNEPEREEIAACRPRLREFLALAAPKLIVCVGTLASDHIGHDASGRVLGAQVIDIVHPAFILARMPTAQKHMAVNKCVVQVRSAIADMLQ